MPISGSFCGGEIIDFPHIFWEKRGRDVLASPSLLSWCAWQCTFSSMTAASVFENIGWVVIYLGVGFQLGI